ncbi:phosphoadenosine phosphosulfate reductase family protein [Halomontanus rarus]|uniref:phosphoadenosine phosphosulfate reductase domain-containing protein n=1 Tax=Halomontanus rarus TaxID=3034020 RepID=UPI00307C0023
MTPLEYRKFERHASTDEYQGRLERATGWIHTLFDRFSNPVVNFSAGKDSLVLLHLVTVRCGYDPDVFHFDNGLLNVPGVTEYARERIDEYGGTPFIRTSDGANSEKMVLEEGHGYRGFWGHHSALWSRREWDCRLLGIRGDESRDRRDRFDSDGTRPPVNYDEQYTAAAPVHHFTTRDVWAYIVSNDLEYHAIYDKQGELYDGIDARDNRLVTLYDSEFDSRGALEVSQWLYPGETNALKEIEQNDGD